MFKAKYPISKEFFPFDRFTPPMKMGWCETDDIIHNTLGTAIGVWVCLWQSKRINAQRSANPGKGET